MSNIGAIKIILDQLYTEDSTIALYDASGVPSTHSEIRMSERELFGVSQEYNYEYILKNGIGSTSSGFDSRIGGNNVNVSDFTVSIKGLNQWLMKLNELKIQLSGKTIQYFEFIGTDSDSDNTSIDCLFTGTIEDREYNEFETLIITKSSFVLKRNKCLGKTVTITEYEDADDNIVNQNTPVTFGRSDPDNGIYFKLPRLQYRNNILTRNDFLLNPTFPGLSLFAVVNDDLVVYPNPQEYTWDNIKSNYQANEIQLAFGDYGATILYKLINPTGLYIKISHDSDSPEGEIRKIESFDGIVVGFTMYGYSEIQLMAKYTLEEYYSLVPKPFHDEDGDGLSALFFALASIIDALLEYCLDYVECECIVSNLDDYFIKDSNVMTNIKSLQIEQSDSDIPIININSSIFNEDIGNAKSHIVIPIEDIEPYESTTGDLSQFGYESKFELVNAINGGEVVKGVYISTDSTGRIYDQPTITGSKSNAYDRNSSTSYIHQVRVNQQYAVHYQAYVIAFKITLPNINDTIKFDKIYLGIDIDSRISDTCFLVSCQLPNQNFDRNSGIGIAYRGFYNQQVLDVTKDINVKWPVSFRSLPDKYYDPNGTTKNKYFYHHEHTAPTPIYYTGYTRLELTEITTKQEYDNIYEMLLIFPRLSNDYGPDDVYDTIDIKEIAVIFEKSLTIGTEVYA